MLAATLTACATAPPQPAPAAPATGGGYYKIGDPYEVNGIWYYPHEQRDYDQTGIASWYGSGFHGRLTANGEVFDRNAITAAHPTLPLPSNVRVTDLENGRSIVVRVNDRGPYVNGRIIDLSERAAELLGFRKQGTARVRVTYLGRADLTGKGYASPQEETPPEIANALPAAPAAPVTTTELAPVVGVPAASAAAPPAPTPAAPSTEVQASEPLPDGQVTVVPVPAATAIYVQAGAFASIDNAQRVTARLRSLGAQISAIMKDGQPLYRVRIGPLQDVNQADEMLMNVHNLGHNDVSIVVE